MDTVFEFFVVPSVRKAMRQLFLELIDGSGATYVECQSNDPGLAGMLHEFTPDVSADVILFADHTVTHRLIGDATVRRRRDHDRIFEHRSQPVGDFVVEVGGEVVATGGFMTHYNVPFADPYMEVREARDQVERLTSGFTGSRHWWSCCGRGGSSGSHRRKVRERLEQAKPSGESNRRLSVGVDASLGRLGLAELEMDVDRLGHLQ